MVKRSLRRRILFGLLAYTAALTIAVVVHGYFVNENAEALVWQTLLDSELDHVVERMEEEPGYRWVNTESMHLYDDRKEALPASLAGLAPGVYDEILVDGIERVVMVRTVQGGTLALALDITDLEEREFDMWLTVLGSALTMVAVISVAVFWGVNRLVRPLTTLAARIEGLKPDQPGQRIAVPDEGTDEIVVISGAINRYLERNDRFVERERAFIDAASHELRTPIAVIAGASDVALEQEGVPEAARAQIGRIRRTAQDVEGLISLLLVLAKDASRLNRMADPLELDQVVVEVARQHEHLMQGKDLTLEIEDLPRVVVAAPAPVLQAAIGNLVRNAIENSDRGTIRIRLQQPATVVIEDPGHGMTPEEVSAIYAKLARGGGDRHRGGIGLDLIARLCEHLGWELDVQSLSGRGTNARLNLARSSTDAARR